MPISANTSSALIYLSVLWSVHNPKKNEMYLTMRTIFSDQKTIISPSIVEHTSHVSVAQDEGAVLLCVAQGCDSPEYR